MSQVMKGLKSIWAAFALQGELLESFRQENDIIRYVLQGAYFDCFVDLPYSWINKRDAYEKITRITND